MTTTSNNTLKNLYFFRLINVCLLALTICSCSLLNKKNLLILGENGTSEYQLIIPDEENPELYETALLIKDAFNANIFDIQIVKEIKDDVGKPGIYLGDTQFARKNGIEISQFKGWGYIHKVVGEDLIIAGSIKGSRLGVVKGVCDFLREYVGTRFLLPGKTGIEFLNVRVIAVPKDLDSKIQPLLKFNFSSSSVGVDFYNIANNSFPAGFKLSAHSWPQAIPFEKYRSHPEYSALKGGIRVFNLKGDVSELSKSELMARHQYCLSNPEVQELIYQYLLRSNDEGNDIVSLAQPDGNTHCECEECRKLYGTGDDWGDKIWTFNKHMCERLLKERPEVQVIMLSYQMTKLPPKAFTEFPENAIILLTHIDAPTFAEWNKCKVPGGFAVYIYNWGVYHFVGYLPKKTPSYLENQVRDLYVNNVSGIFKDGVGSCFGLEGPAYYVFGRMFDNPDINTAENLLDEFYMAAFGEAVEPMREFFTSFYQGLELYSEWLGPRSPAQRYVPLEGRKPLNVEDPLDMVGKSTSIFGAVGVRRFIEQPEQMITLIYTPDLLKKLDVDLKQAENMAKTEKVVSRVKLIRTEFNYINNLLTVLYLHNAYQVQPDKNSMKRLLVAIDKWNEMIDSFYNPDGTMKPIEGWPEMKLFRGHSRDAIGLVTLRNWENKPANENPFAWNTNELRKENQIE